MKRLNNILDFRRCHRIEKTPKRPKPQKRRIGSLYGRFSERGIAAQLSNVDDDTLIGPAIVLGIAWLCGWRSDWI